MTSSTGAGGLRRSPDQASGRAGRPAADLDDNFPAPHDPFSHAEVKAVNEFRRFTGFPPGPHNFMNE